MRSEVRVGGRRLDALGIVSGLTDSTVYRAEGWSGDYEASVGLTWTTRGVVPSLRRGMSFQVFGGGALEWSGWVSEVSVTDGGVQVNAYGLGSRATDLPATDGSTVSYVPNVVVDYQAGRSLGFSRAGVDLGTAAVSATVTEVATVAEVLDMRAATLGQKWWVDQFGRVYFRGPGAVKWAMRPGEDYVGTADDEYASGLWGLRATTLNADGDVTATAMQFYGGPNQAETVARFGPREPVVDFTALKKTASVSEITAELTARFAETGARLGWTNGLNLTTSNVRKVGTNVAAPMAVRAGDRLLLPGVTDKSSTTYAGAVTLTLAEVKRYHDEQRAEVKPLGLAPRGFSAALQAAQAPAELVTSA